MHGGRQAPRTHQLSTTEIDYALVGMYFRKTLSGGEHVNQTCAKAVHNENGMRQGAL